MRATRHVPRPIMETNVKKKATWYHAGCDVCVSAENARARIAEAKQRGVKTIPALVVGDDVFHVNFGANLADLG